MGDRRERARRCAVAAALALGITGASAACGGPKGDAVDVVVRLTNERFVLPNGVAVVLHPDAATDTVHVQLRVHAGSADDPRGREGLAHLVEHLVFDGAPALGEGRGEALTAKMAAVENASTGFETTDYYVTAPPDHVSRALWIVAQRFAHPMETVDVATFERERRVVTNEWREHYRDAPYGASLPFLFADLHPPGDPYAHTPIGHADAFGSATLDEARAFVARHYVGRRATLAVAGRFDARQVRERVAEWFGGVPAGEPKPAVELARELVPARASRRDVRAGVRFPRVVLGWASLPARDGWGQAASLGFDQLEGAAYVAGKARHGAKLRNVDAWQIPLPRGGVRALVVELAEGVEPDEARGIAEDVLSDGFASADARDQGRYWNPGHAGLVTRGVFTLEHPEGRAERLLDDLSDFGRADAFAQEMHARLVLEPQQVREAVLVHVMKRPHVVQTWLPTEGASPGGLP